MSGLLPLPLVGHTGFFPLRSTAGTVSNLWRQSREVAMDCREKQSYNILRLVSGCLVQAIKLEGTGMQNPFALAIPALV